MHKYRVSPGIRNYRLIVIYDRCRSPPAKFLLYIIIVFLCRLVGGGKFYFLCFLVRLCKGAHVYVRFAHENTLRLIHEGRTGPTISGWKQWTVSGSRSLNGRATTDRSGQLRLGCAVVDEKPHSRKTSNGSNGILVISRLNPITHDAHELSRLENRSYWYVIQYTIWTCTPNKSINVS